MSKLKRMVATAATVLAVAASAFATGTGERATNSHPVLHFFKKIGVVSDKSGWMGFVAFSPDGTMVASDGAATPDDFSGDLTIWSFPGGRFIKRLPGRPDYISRDWKYFVDWNFKTNKREVRSVESGNVVAPSSGNEVNANGQLSPDGTVLATSHWDLIGLRNARTGERIAALRGFGRYVSGISFSKDGKLLAAGTDAGGLQIWDVRLHKRLHSLNLGWGYVSEPAFSPDGRFVAVGIYGTGTVWLVDVHTGRLADKQKVSDIGCGAVAFSPDGKYLITPSTGGLITWPYDVGGTIRVFRVKRAFMSHESE